MKKFLSLICAAAITLGAYAAPPFATKRLAVEKQKFEQNVIPAQKQVKLDFATLKKNALRAPKAKKAETNVTLVDVQSSYKDGVLSMGLIASDRVFALEINLPAGVEDLVSGQTYTLADMIAEGCAGYDNSFSWFVMFTQVSLTKTVAADGAISIVADITDEASDIWHLSYSKAAPAPVDEVIDLTFTTSCSKKYYADTKDWYLVAQNSDYAVVLDLLSENADNIPTGSFESENFDLDYTGIYDFEVGNSLIKATSAAAEISVSNDTTFILAVLKCNDGKTYRAKLFYADPKFKDPVEVAIATFTSTDYDTDMYYILKNAAGDSIFYFDIYKDQSAQDITLGQTYTKDDMDGSYSWMKLAGTSVTYFSAEFKKTKTDGLVRIEATVSDKDGNVYHLVYQESGVVPTGEEVILAFDSAMNVPQYYDDGAWELYTQQGDTMAAFVYVNNNPASPAGEYTAEDLQASYSGIKFGDEYIAFASGSFSVTETDARIDLTADMLGNNGVLYHISMFFLKPQAQAQETITADNLTINTNYYSYYGVGIFTASSENDTIELTINIKGLGADMAGEYVAGVDFNGTITPVEGEETEIYSGTVTIAVAENGDVKLTGKVLAVNLTEYTLDLTYIKPEPQTHNVTIANATGEYQEAQSRVKYTLNSEDGNYRFFFAIYLPEGAEDVEFGKVYDFANDMRGNTNASYGMTLDGTYTYIDYAEATFVKNVVEDTTKIDVAILDVDGNSWNLSYKYVTPKDPTELHLQYDNQTTPFEQAFGLYDVVAGEGYISLSASNDANGYVSLQIFANTLEAGVYEINATKEQGTILASVGVAGGYVQPSFAGIRNANGQFSASNLWFLQVGTLTVAEDGSAVLEAKNSYGIDVKATFEGIMPPHLDYDTYADFNEDFAEFEAKRDEEEGYITIIAENDNNAYIAIALYSSAETLAAGIYPINASKAENTVLASVGVEGGYIQPSFAGYLTEDGRIADVWFLVDGTITVNEDGTIIVDALNSLGKAIKSTLGVTSIESIDKIDASDNASKRLENGNLFIEKNGRTYNVQGAVIR